MLVPKDAAFGMFLVGASNFCGYEVAEVQLSLYMKSGVAIWRDPTGRQGGPSRLALGATPEAKFGRIRASYGGEGSMLL